MNSKKITKRRFVKGIGVSLVSISIAGCTSDEDSGGEFSLEGTVLNSDDEPIGGALVSANNEETETDDDGQYAFKGLSDGEYTVEVESDGYESEEETISLPQQEDTPLKIVSFNLQDE